MKAAVYRMLTEDKKTFTFLIILRESKYSNLTKQLNKLTERSMIVQQIKNY